MRSPSDQVLAQPTRARVFALLQTLDAPVETAEIACVLDLHPSGLRGHLDQLESAGLVVRARGPQSRGRPRDTWKASSDATLEGPPSSVTEAEILNLAELRAGLRRYLAWAEEQARQNDTTPAQFQLCLAVHAHPSLDGPTVSELADALQLRHHSVVGLIDRAEAAGTVRRVRDLEHASRVKVQLTALGGERLAVLAALHVRELTANAAQMHLLWSAFAGEPTKT